MGTSGRSASLKRKTKETSVSVTLSLDGSGTSRVRTGVGFLDHMLELFARHGRFDLECECEGDTEVDQHHSVEDVGIVLGQAIATALGEMRGIERFSDVSVPMQESLARVALDLSGRPHLTFEGGLPKEKVGEFDVELVGEFLEALATNARMCLHVDLVRTGNTHHGVEAIFKALARALRSATRVVPGAEGEVPSTKGVL
jgi:imidazoleglycerol-phosphate dehydratase